MEFLTAYFSNNERTVAKAIYEDDEGNQIPYIISCEDGNPQWEKVLEKLSIDELHENTVNWFREQQIAYEEQIIELGKERGMIIDAVENSTDLYKAMAKALFTPFDVEEDKEKLFLYKLTLFENDVIKDSNNKELKASLRKAQDIISATKIAIQIAEDSR